MKTFGDTAILQEPTDPGGGGRAESVRQEGSRSRESVPLPRREGPVTPLPVRLVRSARATLHIVGGLATTVFVFPWIGQDGRQVLIRRWCVQFLRMLRVEARVHWRHDGAMPGNVLIVANHISWLDIFVLSSLQPARFIAKADLRRLPVVGRLIANVGTLFIERERRRDTHTVNRHTVEALARGDVVAVFPEGTTSDGVGLLKFHSSLLQSVVDAKGHVQPIAIRYRTPDDEHCIGARVCRRAEPRRLLLARDGRARDPGRAARDAGVPRGRRASSRALPRRRRSYPNGFGVTGARPGT